MASTRTAPVGQPQCPKQYPRYTTTNDTYAHSLYHDELEEGETADYLGSSEAYDPNRKAWSIPDTLTGPEALVDALYSIFSSIMQRLMKARDSGGAKRHLIKTKGHPQGEEKDNNGYALCPVLLVHGVGPSFQNLSMQKSEPATLSVGYSDMATFCTVKLDSDMGAVYEQVDEMETYARRILREQPSRRFVRALMLTERHARLFHFDRAGVEITPLFDIHQHPTTLVRLIVGLSSADERVIGFDTSIRWCIGSRGKLEGTLTTSGPDGEARVYRILGRLSTPRNEIRGRATTCWRVQDPDTLEELIVKDSWRPEHRRGEYELLELVKGVPGVVQMVSYEAGLGETRDFRCPSTLGSFRNRVATRVTMKAYGRSIEYFTSILQLLCALRDAIAAHRRLVGDDIQILHRDVAPQNVLLGRVDAPAGERGVLIDFDVAFKATEAQPTINADHNIGIRTFQSLSVLSSKFMDYIPAHDYLDDLQSFFFMLVYIMLVYRPDGSCRPRTEEGPSILSTWDQESADDAFTNKRSILGEGSVKVHAERFIKASWGPICLSLFQKFHAWTALRSCDKHKLAYEYKGPEPLLLKREEYYSAVLGMFDEAIEATRVSGAAPDDPTAPHSLIPPYPHPRRSARILDLVRSKTQPSPGTEARTLSHTGPHPTAVPPTQPPRRSARIQKRRLDHDEDSEKPHPKAKRIKNGSRVAS